VESRKKKLIFVCSGNTCRSSMAEALFRRLLDEDTGLAGEWTVSSAGLTASPGAPAAPMAVEAMSERGLDLSSHRATLLTADMVEDADLIVTMTNEQKRAILGLDPDAGDRVFTLKEYISDPKERRERIQARQQAKAGLDAARERFRRAHREELEALQQRRSALLAELARVEALIDRWEHREAESVTKEQEQVDRLDREIRAFDVVDPFGQPLEVYERCAGELEDAVRRLAERLRSEEG